MSLRLILGTFSVAVVPFGFNLSFAWLSIYICGFFYGPIIGLAFGAIMDTISFFLFGGIWFWLYAIQEPIIGLVAGIFGSCYFLQVFKSIKIQIIIQKILIYIFIFTTIGVVIFQFYSIENPQFQTSGLSNINIFIILILVIMSLFLFANEIQNWYYYKRSKELGFKNEYSLYLYASLLIVFCTILFSFLLGPIFYVKYLEYINGVTPSKYLQYGTMYYLVPRVLKEAIKTPLYIIIFIGAVSAIKVPFRSFVSISMNRW